MFYKKNDENVLSAANQYFDDFKRLDDAVDDFKLLFGAEYGLWRDNT